VELGALREYRDQVGRRTREVVGGFKPQDWEGTVAADAVQRAAGQGAFGVRTEQIVKGFPGRPRAAMLSGIALFHSAGHRGEAATVRTAGGFGPGVWARQARAGYSRRYSVTSSSRTSRAGRCHWIRIGLW